MLKFKQIFRNIDSLIIDEFVDEIMLMFYTKLFYIEILYNFIF